MEHSEESDVNLHHAVERSDSNEEEGAETGRSEGEQLETAEEAGMTEGESNDEDGEEEEDVDDDRDEEMAEDEFEVEEDSEEDGDEDDQDEEGEEEEDDESDELGEEDEDVADGNEEEEEEDEEDEDQWEMLDETEKCPVCLDSFVDKEVGTPESCDHIFCLDCILEWSRNVNTCPKDRSLFRTILVRHSLHGEVVRRIEVDERKPEEQDEEDATYCEVCGRCDREDRLLLCDGCDAGYHCECLDPQLQHIPIEEWYCPECVAQNRHQEDAASSEEELEIVEHPSHQPAEQSEARERSLPRRRRLQSREHPPARAIARTHVSERVRARVTQARAERRKEQPAGAVPRARSTATRKKPVKRRTTKKRKTTRKRRTTKKRKTTSKTGSTSGKKVTRRRKVKRRTKKGTKKRVKAAVPKTIRGRIAGKLMLVKPRTGSMMPDIKVKNQQSLGFRRSEIGAAKLLITGHDNLLDMSEIPSTSKTSAPSRSTSAPNFVSSSSTPDLLGSIISGQDMLHMSSTDVTINRDGSLTKNIKDDKAPQPRMQLSHLTRESGITQTRTSLDGRESSKSPSDKDGEKAAKDGKDLHGKEQHRQRYGSAEQPSQTPDGTARISFQDAPLAGDAGDDREDSEGGRDEGDDFDDEEEDAFDEALEGDEEEEPMEIEEDDDDDQPSYTEKVSRKRDGSITCEASSSSFEESDEEGTINEKRSSSKPSRRNEDQELEGPGKAESQDSKIQDHGRMSNFPSGDSKDGSGKSRRKSSVEEGLVEDDDDDDGRQSGRDRRESSVSSDEGLIEDEQDFRKPTEKLPQMMHSDEEGLIADDDDVNRLKGDSSVAKEAGKQESTGAHAGNSSAEEGEVKSDEEEGSSSSRKKRKRERRRQRNRKDTRTVVIDSESTLTVPKRPLAEILGAQKMAIDSRSSDSAASRERDYERADTQRPETGVFGDLRHVIQVKRDVPHKRPSRYEAYWAELERQRAVEAQMAEKSAAWERHGIYERPYPYEEDWNRMILDRKPLEPQWENFTIHRERSPSMDWRKERGDVEPRVEAERRIEMVALVDHERRFDGKRRGETEQRMEAERHLLDRKVSGRKDVEREKKVDQRADLSRSSTNKKSEMDKGRSDHKKDKEAKRESRKKGDLESKSLQKGDASRRKSLNPSSEGSRRNQEESRKEANNPKRDPEKDRHVHKKEREKPDKLKGRKNTDANKNGDSNRSESRRKNPELTKLPSSRDKDKHKTGYDSRQKSDRDVSKDRRGLESSKVKGRDRSKEHSTSQEVDRSRVHDRSSSRGLDHLRKDGRHPGEGRGHHSASRSKERSTSRGHSEHSSKRPREHSSHHVEVLPAIEGTVSSDKQKRASGKSKDNATAPSKEKEKKRNKDGSKRKVAGNKVIKDVQQATSTSDNHDNQVPVQTRPAKRFIRHIRSPSTSLTGETGDELETSHQQSAKQLPITVPATEMVIDKPVVEKVKKKKKDKTKKIKNKGGEKEGTKVKKTKKAKNGKNKKQKVVTAEAAEIEENTTVATKEFEQLDDQSENHAKELPGQMEEAVPETSENNLQPATSIADAESARSDRPEQTLEKTSEGHEVDEHKNKQGTEKDEDSSSDVEIIDDPVKSIYEEIIDLSQISSDEESYQPASASNKQAKDNTLYDPFEPTASPETISSPDASERNAAQRPSRRSRDRSHSPQRRSNRSPGARRSSPKRRASPRRQRSVSPRRKSPRQRGASKERGLSTRKRSVSPPRKSGAQKRRSPSPRRNSSNRKAVHSPRRSPSRSQRRPASPKRHLSPRKRSTSPRGLTSSKRRRVESPRRRSVSPRRNVSLRRHKSSPKRSISPRRRHVSPRRRSRSPRKRSASPRQRVPQRKRSISPRKQSASPRRSISPKRRKASPKRRENSPRRRYISPRKQTDSSRRQSVSPRRSVTPHKRDFSSPRRTMSGKRRSVSSRSSSSSSKSSRSPSSSSSWSSSTGSWSTSSYSRSPSYSRGPSVSRSPSPRRRRYSRDRSSSSFRSDSSFTSERSSSHPQDTPPRRRSISPKRMHSVHLQSPSQTSPTYQRRTDSEKTPPAQPHQDLPDSTQGSYRVVPSSPRSPDQTTAPATSTTDSHLSSKATSQISHILGQLASNPAIQSALNSANLMQGQHHSDGHSSDGSVSGFLKSSEASFSSPPGRTLDALQQDSDDKDLQNLADVNEDNIESSAVDLYNKNSRDRYLKKLQHQERVVEEVKLALKPYYQKREVNKDDYKEILRKSVNQVCHSKSGEINPVKIKKLIEGYIKKFRGKKKVEEKKDVPTTSRPDLAVRLLTKS